MKEFLRAAFVIGRRDFTATVYSRSFLLFLISPLIIITLSLLVSGVMQNATREDIRAKVAVVASEADFAALNAARDRLRPAFGERGLSDLIRYDPQPDAKAQAAALLRSEHNGVVAVLTGGLAHPTLTGAITQDGSVNRELTLLIAETKRDRAVAQSRADIAPTKIEIVGVAHSGGGLATARAITARMGQMFLFFLTVLLSGMLLSNMLEEKSNKVIEVLAAAVPIDAIFLGKIVSMLAISLVGVTFWSGGAFGAMLMWGQGDSALPDPAVGWPIFIALIFIYFSINYLLLGALFLGIGSQANSVREVQTLSMPITVGQMLVFALASMAAGQLGQPIGIGAAIFPFSSPLTMIARAAEHAAIWPHLTAIAWQALWVLLIVRLGSMLFRRNVLKSGGAPARAR
jgi:ABC-2 type transport system permease protein